MASRVTTDAIVLNWWIVVGILTAVAMVCGSFFYAIYYFCIRGRCCRGYCDCYGLCRAKEPPGVATGAEVELPDASSTEQGNPIHGAP